MAVLVPLCVVPDFGSKHARQTVATGEVEFLVGAAQFGRSRASPRRNAGTCAGSTPDCISSFRTIVQTVFQARGMQRSRSLTASSFAVSAASRANRLSRVRATAVLQLLQALLEIAGFDCPDENLDDPGQFRCLAGCDHAARGRSGDRRHRVAEIGGNAQRYEDGHEPDFANASLAELFAWSLVRHNHETGRPI